MNTSSLIGHSVTHISYGPGEILTANDKLVMVRFETGEYRKFQFPQAFASYLMIDDDSLQAEVLDIDKERKQQADAEKMLKGAENVAEEARRTNEAKSLAVAPQKASRPKLARTCSIRCLDTVTSTFKKHIRILKTDTASGSLTLRRELVISISLLMNTGAGSISCPMPGIQ